MLPIGTGQGELWNGNTLLCQVDYEISPPLPYVTVVDTQHIKLVVHDFDCEELLNIAGLTLVLADGSRHRLPRPINRINGDKRVECFMSADVQSALSG